jgi:hypothetical protein
MKKILSFALVLVMIFGLSVTAFAAEEITNTNDSSSTDVHGTYIAGTSGGTVFSVDISWTDMNFTYYGASSPIWDPVTHTYSGEEREAGWADSNAYIEVTNHSNTHINVNLSYSANDDFKDAKVLFQYNGAYVGRADNGMGKDGAGLPQTVRIGIAPSGVLPEGTKDALIGSITVYLIEDFNDQNVYDWLDNQMVALVKYTVNSEEEAVSGQKYILNADYNRVCVLMTDLHNAIHNSSVSQNQVNKEALKALDAFYNLEIKVKP